MYGLLAIGPEQRRIRFCARSVHTGPAGCLVQPLRNVIQLVREHVPVAIEGQRGRGVPEHPSRSPAWERCRPWLDPPGDALGDFLEDPLVPVRIREARVADV